MNDASHSSKNQSRSDAEHSAGAGRAMNPRTVLLSSAVGVLALLAYITINASREQRALKATEDRLVAWHGLTQESHKTLSSDYADKQGRLVADPPTDASRLVDPDPLVVAHYEDADAEAQIVDWDAFQAQLAQATGKQVVRQRYLNSADDVAAIKAGKFHIVALHAADAPYVVNHAGFVPVAVLGDEDGPHTAIISTLPSDPTARSKR